MFDLQTMLVQRVTNEIVRARGSATSRLRILRKGDDGATQLEEVVLPAVGVTIGADPTCDVVLIDPAVSRRHVKISRVRDVLRREQRAGAPWLRGTYR